jgi:hypothetical protein
MDHKREVWLLRHGATEWSKNGRHTGHTDIALLPEGEEQARALAVTLASRHFAKVMVSPALRARRTCELAGLIGCAEVTEDLWEYCVADASLIRYFFLHLRNTTSYWFQMELWGVRRCHFSRHSCQTSRLGHVGARVPPPPLPPPPLSCNEFWKYLKSI